MTGPRLPAYGAVYSRLANSELIERTDLRSDTTTLDTRGGSAALECAAFPASQGLASTVRAFEAHRDLLASVENRWAPGGAGEAMVSKYAYVNDNLARRTSVVRTGSAFAGGSGDHFDLWGYNDRDELTGSQRFSGTDPLDFNAPVADLNFGYEYDWIGNRKTSAAGSSFTAYTSNALNQYTRTLDPNETTFTYDLDGNLISKSVQVGGDKPNIETTYEHDALGRRTKETVNRDDGTQAVTKYVYDLMGRLTETWEDFGGLNLCTAYTYDGHGQLATVTSPAGTVTKYEYDYRNRLWKVIEDYGTGRANLVTEYEYDGNGNQTKVKDANGDSSTFEYNARNERVRSVDAEGYETLYRYQRETSCDLMWVDRGRQRGPGGFRDVVRYEHDDLGRVVLEVVDPIPAPDDGQGHWDLKTWYWYPEASCGCGGAGGYIPNQILDPANRTTWRRFDLLGRVTQVRRQVGGFAPCDDRYSCADTDDAITWLYYDAEGNLYAAVGPEGEMTLYTYDGAGRRLTERKLAEPGNPSDANDLLATYTWDGAGNLRSVLLPNGHQLTADYDGADRLRHVYDNFGPTPGVLAEYAYDADGNVLTRIDGGQRTWTYQYDRLGRVVEEHDPLVDSAQDRIARYGYDSVGNLVLSNNNNWVRTAREYDKLGRLVKVIADQRSDEQEYPGEPVILDGQAVEGTQGEGVLVEEAPEGGGGPVMGPPREVLPVSTPTANTTTQYEYDGAGKLTKLTDHDGNATSYRYSIEPPPGTTAYVPTVTTTYPDGGEVKVFDNVKEKYVVRLDQRGVKTTLWFDDLGHLYQREYWGTATRRTETFAFDRSGRLRGATRDEVLGIAEPQWSRTYDKLGRPVSEVQRVAVPGQSPATSATGFGYTIDKVNFEMSWTMTTPQGRQVKHVLDRLYQLVEARLSDGSGTLLAKTEWAHNGAGQRVSATLLNSVESTYTYDANGRLDFLAHAKPVGGDPYVWDLLFSADYGYDAVGNRMFTRLEATPERSERYGYDNLNRLTVMDRGVLNADGSAVETLDSRGGSAALESAAFPACQGLDHAVLQNSQQWASLDHRGNWLDYRWAQTVGGQATTYLQTRTASGVNAYISIDPDGPDPQGGPPNLPAVTPGYDAAGNMMFDPIALYAGGTGPVGQWYDYDEENRVTAVYRADGSDAGAEPDVVAQYEYDALGRRIHTIEYVDATTGDVLTTPRKTRHVYVGLETVEEYQIAGSPGSETATLLREFLWGDPERFPEPVAMVTHNVSEDCEPDTYGQCVFHYLHDLLGSVVGLTDADGALVERYTYDPYGRTLIEKWNLTTENWQLTTSSAFGNPWMWTAQRYDAGTGLYAFLFRTYSPGLERWLQRDPAGYVDSVNLYEYAHGQPINVTDPRGDKCNGGQDTGADPAKDRVPTDPNDPCHSECMLRQKACISSGSSGRACIQCGDNCRSNCNKVKDQLTGGDAMGGYGGGIASGWWDRDPKCSGMTESWRHRGDRHDSMTSEELREARASQWRWCFGKCMAGLSIKTKAGTKVAAKIAGKAGAKTLAKIIPLVGWGVTAAEAAYCRSRCNKEVYRS